MLYFLSCLFGILAVAILHAKTWIYFKIKNPNKSILYGYLSGLIGFYFILSLFPLRTNNRYKPYFKKMRNLTYLFYFLLLLSFILGSIMIALTNKKI